MTPPYSESPLPSLPGAVVIAVQVEKPAPHRFVLVEPLLKPVIGIPQPIVRPVHTVFGEPFQILRAFPEICQEIEEIRQFLFPDIKKIIRIGSDEARDEVSAVLGGIEPPVLSEQKGDVVMSAVDDNGAGNVPAVLEADPQVGQIGVVLVHQGKKGRAGLGKGGKSPQVVIPCRI